MWILTLIVFSYSYWDFFLVDDMKSDLFYSILDILDILLGDPESYLIFFYGYV